MTQYVSDCIKIMRVIIGRKNVNDPESDYATLFKYLNDFINFSMSDDIKIFEQFGTMSFSIDDSVVDGVYTFNDVGITDQFTNISQEGFITLAVPPTASISWNRLEIIQNPGAFYDIWGINNYSILIPGYPTQMLYYGTEMVFRTIPDQEYNVQIFGYKIVPAFDITVNEELPFDYWLRYLAYGAAVNYVRDYRYDKGDIDRIETSFARERALLMTRTHNQIKMSRAMPRF